jgi:pentatricopeptide repeat protein
MAFVSSAVEELWRSIGVELVIFCVTLVFALMLRRGKKISSKLTKGFQTTNLSTGTRPSGRSPTSLSKGSPVNAATRSSRDTSRAGAQEDPADRRWTQCKDPSQIIDEVVESMRDMPGTKMANKALNLYSDLQKNMKDVRINEVARRSHHSALDFYTTLLQCAIRVGKYRLVEDLLEDMAQQNVRRSLSFYESAMKQLAGQKQYHLALSIYDHLVADGFEASAVTCSCLINFAAEVGEFQRAVGFFDKLASISTPSIRAYMTILRVHSKRQDWHSSLHVFRDMQKRKVKLDSLVFNVILATGAQADKVDDMEALLREVETFKPPISDAVSYNTLIKAYAQRSDALKAIQVIKRMNERGLLANAISYNTAMDAAVRGMRIQEAWDLLKDMRKSGFRPDKFTCSILVKGLAKNPQAAHIKNGLELLQDVDSSCDNSLKSTLYLSVLEAAAQLPDTSMLMATFEQMQQHKVPLTMNTYRLIVQALGQEGNSARCSQMWQQILSDGVRPHASLFVALLEAYLKQGQVDEAIAAFESLRGSIKGDLASSCCMDNSGLLEECCIALIRSLCRISREPEATHAYLQARSDGMLAKVDSATGMMLARVQADAGNLSHAWMTIEDMLSLGHKPNDATIQSFLSACMKHAHTLYAKDLLKKTSDHNIALSQSTYLLLLRLFGRCQQLQDAMSVYEVMVEKHGLEPWPHLIVSLLRTCFQCRQPGKALELLEKVQARAPDKPLDGNIYAAAFEGCAAAGQITKGLALAEDAARRKASLPADALEVLAQAALRRGQASSSELERLGQLAKDLNVGCLPSEGSVAC